ncbi:hypothetical protein, partial [Bacillus sp. UNC41MFS5]|uniref:hypothetical protein n=1 Tax=Bacillus sp. UNC41MFS5 TaxID=1449046 RepID=UPI00054EB5AD
MGNNYKQLPSGDYAENVNLTNAYDSADDMMKVKSLQKKWKDAFTGSSLNTTTNWDIIQTGSGHTITVAGGELKINTGITINSETILQSKEVFTDPVRVIAGLMLSQKIANQEFYLELVSVNPTTLVADGQGAVAWKYDYATSATTTTNAYEVQNGGMARLGSGAVTTLSATAYHLAEIEMFSDEVWLHQRAMDSSSGRSNSYVRHQQIPDPNGLYKIRIRAKNLGTAPATATDFKFQFITAIDFAELTAEITAGRGNAVAGQGIFATVTGTVSANLGTMGGSWYKDTTTNLGVSTSYTGSTRTAGGTSTLDSNRFRVVVNHLAGLTHGHLVIEQSDDNSTWRETHKRPVPSDTNFRTYDFPIVTRYIRVKFVNGATAQTAFYLGTAVVRTDGSADLDRVVSFTDSTTAQGISATFTGVTLDFGGNHEYNTHKATVFADQAGTLSLEQSRDGSTWRTMASVAVVANTQAILSSDVHFRYARVKFVNGATANTVFDLA